MTYKPFVIAVCEKKKSINRRIDDCMVEIIDRINDEGIFKTLLCCCGHGKYPPSIIIKDEDDDVREYYTMKKLEKRKGNRYYKLDKEGYYFVEQLNREK